MTNYGLRTTKHSHDENRGGCRCDRAHDRTARSARRTSVTRPQSSFPPNPTSPDASRGLARTVERDDDEAPKGVRAKLGLALGAWHFVECENGSRHRLINPRGPSGPLDSRRLGGRVGVRRRLGAHPLPPYPTTCVHAQRLPPTPLPQTPDCNGRLQHYCLLRSSTLIECGGPLCRTHFGCCSHYPSRAKHV